MKNISISCEPETWCEDVPVASSPFKAAYNMFRQFLHSSDPISWEDWCNLPHDYKSASLYVQFYDQITLAWYKAKCLYGEDEEGVETVLQYLEKNVPIIEKSKNKYTPQYIYRVAYNCLYCICHDRKIDQDRYALEMSNLVVTSDGDELDLFDTVTSNSEDVSYIRSQDEFWAIIEDMGESTKDLVESILKNGRLPSRLSPERLQIVETLKERLGQYMSVFCN